MYIECVFVDLMTATEPETIVISSDDEGAFGIDGSVTEFIELSDFEEDPTDENEDDNSSDDDGKRKRSRSQSTTGSLYSRVYSDDEEVEWWTGSTEDGYPDDCNGRW